MLFSHALVSTAYKCIYDKPYSDLLWKNAIRLKLICIQVTVLLDFILYDIINRVLLISEHTAFSLKRASLSYNQDIKEYDSANLILSFALLLCS